MTIDHKNKKVILNKEKTIEISKIISNEKRQEKRIEELEDVLKKKDSIINVKDKRIDDLVTRVTLLGDEILIKGKEMMGVVENQVKTEKKKSQEGFYLFVDVGTAVLEDYTHLYFGGKYLKEKTYYSVSVNPINKKTYYSFGVGFKFL